MDFTKIPDLHRKGTTVRRFKSNVEADEEYKYKSADDLQKAGLEHNSITLKERMLLELWYFKTTGGHLDLNNWTLCNGSSDMGDGVFSAGWSSVNPGFSVGWRNIYDFSDHLRSRVVVS